MNLKVLILAKSPPGGTLPSNGDIMPIWGLFNTNLVICEHSIRYYTLYEVFGYLATKNRHKYWIFGRVDLWAQLVRSTETIWFVLKQMTPRPENVPVAGSAAAPPPPLYPTRSLFVSALFLPHHGAFLVQSRWHKRLLSGTNSRRRPRERVRSSSRSIGRSRRPILSIGWAGFRNEHCSGISWSVAVGVW